MIIHRDKPSCRLIDTDGNVFALIGLVMHCLRNAGLSEQAKELSDRILKNNEADSYGKALQIIGEYVEIR